MPNIKSAKKRVLVNVKKNAVNKDNKSEVKTAIKKLNALIEAGNYDEAIKLYPETASIIDSSVSKGVYHKNTAANKKSGLIKRIIRVRSNLRGDFLYSAIFQAKNKLKTPPGKALCAKNFARVKLSTAGFYYFLTSRFGRKISEH